MNASSRSKRKRGGQTAETMKIIRNTMKYVNDQSEAIVEWPSVQHQSKDAFYAEVMKQLQAIPELSTHDRRCLMWTLMCNVHDMKALWEISNELKLDYCTVMLEDNA
ncbi:hypothetical protein Csa_000900 [Cucumis sativus]|uniref:Uncharacterized protein n=1 Tax=Cucumis sativus TaxID=3659 RepID=A0A0A0LEB9_CUCSA|nr:hypothetical protein Csa_000900 [Cucumis sativus]